MELLKILNTLNEDITDAYDTEGNMLSQEQVNFFKDSKIRDRKHNLRVCYHGSDAEFNQFKIDLLGKNSGNRGWFGNGFYFTTSDKLAKSYGSIVNKYYLNIKNPFTWSSEDSGMYAYGKGMLDSIGSGTFKSLVLDPMSYVDDSVRDTFTDMLKEDGYDGVIYSYGATGYKPNNISGVSKAFEIVAFYPNQIKLITNKNPSDSDNITEGI